MLLFDPIVVVEDKEQKEFDHQKEERKAFSQRLLLR